MFAKKLAALVAACALALCPAAFAAPRTDLNYALSSEPNSLDPMAIAKMSTFTVTYAIYDNLYEEDGAGNYVPSLATGCDISADGMTYTFALRTDVKFQDGTPMTADDVVYSINRTIAKGWAADMTAPIDSVEKADDATVVLKLKYPFGAMIGSLASPYFSIMSKAYAEANGDDAVVRRPMGTGAYKFVEWVSGDHITLQANEDYFAGAPAIKTVTFRPVTDKNTGLVALEAGEIDVFLNVNPSDVLSVQDNPDLKFYSTDLAAVMSLIMNVEAKPLDNELVRQAISYAVNKDNIILGALDGFGVAANSAIPPTCAGYSADVTGYPCDTEKAKELLAQAGLSGLKLSLKMSEDSKVQKVATILQADLKRAGIDLDIQILEGGAFMAEVNRNGNFETTIMSWCAMFPDAYSLLYSQFHKDCYGPTGNVTHIVSDELSGMLDNAAGQTGEAMTEAYKEVAQYLNDHAVDVPLVFEPTTITTAAGLQGVAADTLSIYKIKRWSWQ